MRFISVNLDLSMEEWPPHKAISEMLTWIMPWIKSFALALRMSFRSVNMTPLATVLVMKQLVFFVMTIKHDYMI